jgi:hypothetical protein
MKLIRPAVLVDVALATQTPDSLLPSTEQLRSMVSQHAERTYSTLAMVDQLVPCTSDAAEGPAAYDAQGRSRAARYAEAALAILRADRTSHTYLLTVLSAAMFAKDTLDIPSGSRGFFAPTTDRTKLADFIREVDGTLSFALAEVDDVALPWHQSAIAALGKSAPQDFMQELLLALKTEITETNSDIAARVFRDVLSRHFRQSGAGEKELEVWLAFAMGMMKNSKPYYGSADSASLFIALILSVKPLLLDNEKYQLAQNRLASYLTTVRPSEAGKDGIPAIRCLLASAPPADAPSTFIPQQRAIFVLRHVGSWLTSDEADDFDESMEVYVAQLYTALAPVVQDVSGSHWDAIFDMIESGLGVGVFSIKLITGNG